NGAAGDFTVTIDWGDGSAATFGSVVANAHGGFDVTGGHTYDQEVTSLPITTVIRDAGGSVATAIGTAQVADAPLAAAAATIAATEGAAFSGAIASFSDANPNAAAGDFTATIDWGDGSATTSGSVIANTNGGFDVTGAHIYDQEATSLPITVMIGDAGGSIAIALGTAQVADAPLAAAAATIAATEGAAFSGAIASFSDANPNAAAGDFTVTIDWGDGSATTSGSIIANTNGGFDVTGAHTYD